MEKNKNSVSLAKRKRYFMAELHGSFSFPIWEVAPFPAVPSIRLRRIPAIHPIPVEMGI
jgi:hypothetical protein